MKIETNVSKKFLSRFDEARGIALHKKSVLKKKKAKTLSYLEGKIIMFIILIIISLLSSLLCCLGCRFIIFSYLIYILSIIYIVHAFITVFTIYCFRGKQHFNNTILLDKDGITDESYYGIKMTFHWDKILGIVLGKYTVTILTDTPCYFYFDISKKEDILKMVEKYGAKDKIIPAQELTKEK